MDISAFLDLPMAKEKEKVELRLVDEDAESSLLYVRLHNERLEEVEELPIVRLGDKAAPDPLDAEARAEIKTRSNEPDLGALIEGDTFPLEHPWETQAVPQGTFPWGWLAVVACLFTAGISWSLMNLNRGQDKQTSLADAAIAIIEQEEREKMDAGMLVAELEATVRNFFGTGSVEEMLRHVRHPERVAPLMEKHYSGTAPAPIRVVKIVSLAPITIDRRATFWMVTCDLEGSLRTQMVLEAYSGNKVKVDWESFVCYQPMVWNEFARTRPGGYEGDFRVYVQKDHFHSHEFADSEVFDSYRLTALHGEETLFGYVDRGSVYGQRIAELVAGWNGSPLPMILRLHLPDGLDSPRGVVVRGLVSPRWLFVDDPGITEP